MSHIKQFQHLKIKLKAIQSATNNFSDDNCIGRGGFGKVYKGELVHSKGKTVVALKRLDRESIQGNPEFWKEVMMLTLYTHENIISLLGYCDDQEEKILIYEYLPKRSLDSYLASDNLTWVQRLKICLGAARGLTYLHTPAKTLLRIVHCDIKSSNILLDNNWNAKISDFGLSKFAPANNQFTYMISNPAGTFGYIDPMYQETGVLTKESDVYSFGVVLFEVLCGRLCYGNQNQPPLVGQVRTYYETNKISELVYSNIKNEIKESSLKLFTDIAYTCLSIVPKERPSMIDIEKALEKALDVHVNGQAAGVLQVTVLDVLSSYLIVDLYPYYHQPQTVKVKNQTMSLYVEDINDQVLVITAIDSKLVNKDRNMGVVKIKLGLTPGVVTKRYYRINADYNHSTIILHVKMLYKQMEIDRIRAILTDERTSQLKASKGTPKDGGLLVIIIHSALYKTNEQNSLVRLSFRGKIRETKAMVSTYSPVWLQEFQFSLEQPPTDEILRLEALEIDAWPGIRRTRSLGCVDISLADVINKKWTNESYELKPGDKRVVDFHIYNSLRVGLQWRTTD